MTHDARLEAEAIFQDLVGRPPELYADLLEARCGSRQDLRSEVERLLRASDDVMGDFMRCPVGEAAPPQRVGRYWIERQIGEGGMGLVYAARQEQPDRAVALKLLRPGLVSQGLLRRFRHEVEALGSLQHPGIAHIYEAGTAEVVSVGGRFEQPFFAMELIQGESLTRYARRNALSTRERLSLFAEVCDAVQHAHQKGIIHRDLKPGNILVDDAGRPKVLDFGIARIASPGIESRTQHTSAGQLLGTLAYMSPEQLSGDPTRLDTRSDVYALGVVAYELLADRTPFDLAGLAIPAAVRVVAEREPARLGAVKPELRGDVVAIIDKALQKEPDRRYGSAAELAADIRRFLRREPISARPAGAMYRVYRFAQRNKALVGGASATLVALLLGVIGTAYGMAQRTRERDAARRQARALQAANDFLTRDLLGQADPHNAPDRDLPLREVLDRAAEKIAGRFPDAPALEANLRVTIGKAYSHLGFPDKAEPQFERALELYKTVRDEAAEDKLVCQMHLAILFTQRAQFEKAERMFLELIELQRQAFGPEHEQTLSSKHNLASIYVQTSRFADAEPILREELDIRSRVTGQENARTAVTMNVLGVLCVYTGRAKEGAELLDRAHQIHRRASGEEHPDTLETLANLGAAYHSLKDYDKAEEAMSRSLEMRRRVLGEDHPSTLSNACNLAAVYGARKRPERVPLLRHALDVQRRTLGENHMDTLLTAGNLAKVAYDDGDYERAETEYRDLAERWEDLYPGVWNAGVTRCWHGRSLLKLKRFDEAEHALLNAHRRLTKILGPEHERSRQVAGALAELYEQWGRSDDALRWRSGPSGE
jgi:tetratricopeptide (TPR) repeat protein